MSTLRLLSSFLPESAYQYMCHIFAILPAYNVSNTIGAAIVGLRKSHPHTTICVVDDGSSDGLQETLERHKPLTFVRHETNLGKGMALRSGFAKAFQSNCPLVLTIDTDGQHNSADVSKFIEKYRNLRCDIIIGSRMTDVRMMPKHRLLSNKMTSYLVSGRVGQQIIDSQCGYRLYKKEALEKLELKCRYFDLETEVLLKAVWQTGAKIETVNVATIYSDKNCSSMRLIDVWRFIRVYIQSFLWKSKYA